MSRNDIWCRIALRLEHEYQDLVITANTLATIFMAKYWGIALGKECKFIGRPKFHRVPESSIVIGENCRFRSAYWSNYIGVNRRCMISTLKKGARVSIGSGCGLTGTVIGAANNISLGRNVLCGSNVTITDTDWHGIRADQRQNPAEAQPVCIEDNVWLGLNVVVLKGVTIGENSVIGAGSIVSKSIPENVIAAGQPAVVIREL